MGQSQAQFCQIRQLQQARGVLVDRKPILDMPQRIRPFIAKLSCVRGTADSEGIQ